MDKKLEKASVKYSECHRVNMMYPEDTMIHAFKTGANWQREQMMKGAIDGVVICDEKLTHGYRDILLKFPEELKVDDKVKMIIVKED